jgi:hypothetical protein
MEEFRFPAFIQTMMILAPTGTIFYPQIQWPKNPIIQRINTAILKNVNQLFTSCYQQNYITEITGGYEVKNNQRGILSFTFNNFASGPKLSHPIDNLTSLTTDILTGKIYSLADLFKPNSPYIHHLSMIVKQQIAERKISTIQEFKPIRLNQDFYIADKTLVILFQRYEITPRPAGYPMFPISIYEIEDIIDENGPLWKMFSSY